MIERLSLFRSGFKVDNTGLRLTFIFFVALLVRAIIFAYSLGQIGEQGIMNLVPDGILYINMAEDMVSGRVAQEIGLFTFGPGFACLLAFFLPYLAKGYYPL